MREAAVHFDTGLSWVDVEDDFSRARRRQVLARLAGWLRRKPDVNRILSFDEATAALGWRDRKSTRLNSSHMSISYAVFCLKKKKTKHFSLFSRKKKKTR